jgi:hypothetical protein
MGLLLLLAAVAAMDDDFAVGLVLKMEEVLVNRVVMMVISSFVGTGTWYCVIKL